MLIAKRTYMLRYHLTTYKQMANPLEKLIEKSFMIAVTENNCDERKFMAFKYIRHQDFASVCVAKGNGLDYDDVVKIARQKKINIVQHTQFTNYLYDELELNDEIPSNLYQFFVFLYLGDDFYKAARKLYQTE